MTPAKPEGIDPKYLKLSYQPARGPLSRRDLLFGPLTPRYEVVPAVEPEVCTAWKGCTQCLTACPQQAIGLDGSAAAIDKAKCIGCGACLPVCPVGAIRQPLLNPERLEAELRTLLTEEVARKPRVLLVVADGGAPPDELKNLPSLRLPSLGAVSAWLLLRAFTLGADGIAILPCPTGCRHRCDQARWERTLRFTRDLLARLGVEAERLVVVGREEVGSAVTLKAFGETIVGLSAHRLQKLAGLKIKEALGLPALLKELVSPAPIPPAPLIGDWIPFGMVKMQASRCTLCGACAERCPSGALAFYEDDESSQLFFDHARCDACAACVQVCPEGALEIDRRLEFSRLWQPAVLAEDQMVRCLRCGAAIAPGRMLEKVQRSLDGAKASSGEALGRYCPSCQMLRSLAAIGASGGGEEGCT